MPRWSKRFSCFYCGCRSAKSLPADIRRWDCQKCEAVNWLDEVSCIDPESLRAKLTCMRQHGEITDPPATVSQPDTRFARARPRSESPPGLASYEASGFCQRCIQNQVIVKDILAEYTPATTGDWESSYKTYVKELQEAYPPVCERCETQARERIKNSDYFVKADNLGRALFKKPNESWIGRRGWQYDFVSVFLSLGKLMWFVSWIAQCLWHAANLVKVKRHPECVWKEGATPTLATCATQVITLMPLHKFCDKLFTSLAHKALILGLLSIWWNPMWVKKMKLIYGRPSGRREYYQLQVIFLALRWAGWHFIAMPGNLNIDARQWKALHGFMLALTLLVSVVCIPTALSTNRL